MPLSLSAMLALFNDNTSGDISAADGRDVITALYDWIPTEVKYLAGRLPSESAHADDDFFTSYTGYTEATASGTASWAAGLGGLGVVFDDQNANDVAATLVAIPGGPPLTIQTAWQTTISLGTNPSLGLCFTDGTATTSGVAGFGDFSNFAAASISGTLDNAATTSQIRPDRTATLQGLVHVRWVWKSANTFAYAYSVDGSNWTDYADADISITLTPTHMGLWVSAWSQGIPSTAVFRYLRVAEADLSV